MELHIGPWSTTRRGGALGHHRPRRLWPDRDDRRNRQLTRANARQARLDKRGVLDRIPPRPALARPERAAARRRPGAELLDVLVQLAAKPADAVLVHALDAELLDEPVDLPSAHAIDVGLHHDRDDRLLTAPPRLQKTTGSTPAPTACGESRARSLTSPRLPQPRAIAVEMRHA